jgi:hypothetical protein
MHVRVPLPLPLPRTFHLLPNPVRLLARAHALTNNVSCSRPRRRQDFRSLIFAREELQNSQSAMSTYALFDGFHE